MYKKMDLYGDGKVTAYIWEPINMDVIGIVHIIHGMAEHMKRYDSFATFLTHNGYVVCGCDLLGHGESATVQKGFFDEKDGYNKVTDSILTLNHKVKNIYSNAKTICFGHSMGSFFAEVISSKYSDEFEAYIFSGTQGPNCMIKLAKILVRTERKIRGCKHESTFLNNLSFGSYNKVFKPNRTEFDWLSRKEKVVDEYIADDMCGFIFTSGAFYDMFCILDYVNKKGWAYSLDKNKRYMLFSGSKDPVSRNGKGVKKLVKRMQKAGVKNIELKLYENGRHEMLNEINREEVFSDILEFINNI